VADLEDALGVRLIERGGQSLALTVAGRGLLSRTEGPMHEVAEALAAARDGMDTPRGLLRVAAPQLFAHVALGGLAAGFVARYPDVHIEAVAEDRIVDLVDERFDVAIRINPRKDSDLVGRRFAHDRMLLVAPPSMVRPGDEGGDPFPVRAVVTSSHRDGDVWSVRDSRRAIAPQPVLRLSSLSMVRDAVATGAGAALLPQSIARDLLRSGRLVTWGIVGDDVDMWVLHTSRRLESPKVRAFVDFMANQYPDGWFMGAA
jgi:DNA-binding transcriptional LysR family regulator